MRRILVILICLMPLAIMAQNSVTIQGRLTKLNDSEKVYLLYPDTTGLIFKIVDSAFIINSQFSFKLKNNLPVKVFLRIYHKSLPSSQVEARDELPIYLISSNPIIQVLSNTNHINEAVVIGSKNNDDNTKYLNMLKPLEKESQRLLAKYKTKGPDANKDTTFMKALIRERDIQNKGFLDLALRFIRSNYDSYSALELLYTCFSQRVIDHKIAELEFNKFSVELQRTDFGKQLSKAIIASKFEPRGDGPRTDLN